MLFAQTTSSALHATCQGATRDTGPEASCTTFIRALWGKVSVPKCDRYYFYSLSGDSYSKVTFTAVPFTLTNCCCLQCLQVPFVRSLQSYSIHRTASPFNRRVTALEWHPAHPSTLVAASKGGDLMLWDFDALNKTTFVQGVRKACILVIIYNSHVGKIRSDEMELYSS